MPRLGALSPVAIVCLAVFGCADAQSRSAGAVPVQRMPVSVRSSLDRTAAWVGDPVTYTVEIVCSPGYDIIEDDLARDRLPLEGLEVRAANTTREARDDGAVLHRARFELASYTPERESLRIGPMSIRYYRREADGRIANQLPIGSVEVPAEDIALRSTLPESAGAVIRAVKPPVLLPWFIHLPYPLGLLLVALPLVAMVLGLTAAIARRRPSAQAQGPTAHRPTEYRMALDEIRQLDDAADPEAVRQAFGRLDHLLREFLAEVSIHVKSLTPDEIDSRAGTAGDMTTQRAVAGVLRECERARYAGPRQPPSRDRLAHALNQAEAVVVSAKGQAR